MILVWWDQYATLARIEFERWSVNLYFYLQQNLQSSPLQHRIGRSQKNLTRCREVIFTAVVGWIFWSWQERFASGGQDGLVSVMTPVRGSSFGSCQVSWPVFLRGKYFLFITWYYLCITKEPNGPPLFLGGWPAAFYGSNLPKYRLAIGVLGKYLSPISVRKFLGPPTDPFRLVRRYFEEVYFRLRNVDGDSILMVWNITSRYQAQLVFSTLPCVLGCLF